MNQVTQSIRHSAFCFLVAMLSIESSLLASNHLKTDSDMFSKKYDEIDCKISQSTLQIETVGECKLFESNGAKLVLLSSIDNIATLGMYIGSGHITNSIKEKETLEMLLLGIRDSIKKNGLDQKAKALGVTIRIQSMKSGIFILTKGNKEDCIECIQDFSCIVSGHNLTGKEFKGIKEERLESTSYLKFNAGNNLENSFGKETIFLGSNNYMKDISSLPGYIETVKGTKTIGSNTVSDEEVKQLQINLDKDEYNDLQETAEIVAINVPDESLDHELELLLDEEQEECPQDQNVSEETIESVCCICRTIPCNCISEKCGAPDSNDINISSDEVCISSESSLEETLNMIISKVEVVNEKNEDIQNEDIQDERETQKQVINKPNLSNNEDLLLMECKKCSKFMKMKKNQMIGSNSYELGYNKKTFLGDVLSGKENIESSTLRLLEQIDVSREVYDIKTSCIQSISYEDYLIFSSRWKESLHFSICAITDCSDDYIRNLIIDCSLILNARDPISKDCHLIKEFGITKLLVTSNDCNNHASLILFMGEDKSGYSALQEIFSAKVSSLMEGNDSNIISRCSSNSINGQMFFVVTLSSGSIDSSMLESILASLIDFINSTIESEFFVVERDILDVKEELLSSIEISSNQVLQDDEKLNLMIEVCNGNKSSNHLKEQKFTLETVSEPIMNEFIKNYFGENIKALIVVS